VWQFAAGIIVGLTAAIFIVWFFRSRKKTGVRESTKVHLEQLKELSRLTGELAHEIKNPLSTIKINLKLISEDVQERPGTFVIGEQDQTFARALRKIAVIQKEVDRLEQILDGFLRYADRGELQLGDVDLNELVTDLVDFYSPQCYSRSITIRQGLHSEPLVCKVDAEKLKQAILNLFINAQEAMNRGGELIVQTNRQQDDAVIQISDTGSGIAPEKLHFIFDAYYSSRPGGGGLGLPTTRRIIEAHNGTITVDSEPGKGTSFAIKLPLLPAADK